VARDWLLRGGLPVLRAQPREEEAAREIIARHDDKDYSLCDAISFAFMIERGVRRVFTFDRHFVQFGKFDVVGVRARSRRCFLIAEARKPPAERLGEARSHRAETARALLTTLKIESRTFNPQGSAVTPREDCQRVNPIASARTGRVAVRAGH
jgi:PIN domain-containing protein